MFPTAKLAASATSGALLEHNVVSAREGVQMATNAKDAKTAIAAAAHVIDSVACIMRVPPNKVGIETLQRAAAVVTSPEELEEIVYTAKLIAAITYSAAAEAMSAAAEEAAPKAAEASLRRRNGYTRLECRVASKY